jgi:hypothetical protein
MSDQSSEASSNAPNPSFGSVTSPPQLNLPKGGGAIRGIGEKFSANPVTGTASLSLPIRTSPGRCGFAPQPSLSYESSAGNGPFGLGWSLQLPEITRRTDKGLPHFEDRFETDIFVLSGQEDLVRVLVQDGTGAWVRESIPPRDGYAIASYRPRIEGLFARIERWTRESDGDTYWRSISKDNITTYYGQTPESRIVDPYDSSKVFSWLISRSQDDKGNVIVYSYIAEDSSNVDVTQANERNRSALRRSTNRYLSRIQYGNVQSLLTWPTPNDLSAMTWLFETVFDYGQGYFQAAEPDAQGRVIVTATLTPTGTWPIREDPFSTYRATFEIRTYRLCQRVLTFHHFPADLGTTDYLVRATAFVYQENSIASMMVGVTESGYTRQSDGTYLEASLPQLEFEYSQSQVQKHVRAVDATSLANLPAKVDGSTYRWLDLDGEGLPSILAEQDDAWFYKRNLTPLFLLIDNARPEPTAQFEDETEVWRLPAFAQARTPQHQFMDLVGDGRRDCVVLQRPAAGFYERSASGGWEPFAALPSVPNIDWQDPNLRLIDVDGDGFSDVLITEQDTLTYYPSLARFGFAAPVHLPKATDEETGPAVIFADNTRAIFLADMSGDGLSDIVRVRNGEICYWPNLGRGRFGFKVDMDGAPWFDTPDHFDAARIRLADIDGSGVSDIIYLAGDGVSIYFNQSGNAWSGSTKILDFPPVDQLASIQALDILGNGTSCLVWTDDDPSDNGRSIRYIEMMGREKPYLLRRSWNNLGAETRVSYAPSTAFYLADRAAGQPWATRLPFPVQVVERVETYDWISRNLSVTRYAYHHGYYDGTEREFRGFGMVEQRDTEEFGVLTQSDNFPNASNIDAASYVPPVLTKTWFHTGAFPMGPRVTRIYDGEYWSESGLTEAEASAMLLPDSPLPTELTGDEIREALRSLKGTMLRQEVYALDGAANANLPYSVSERNYTIVQLQPFGPNRHTVFLTQARDSLDLHYDRKTYMVGSVEVCDPRTTHNVVLQVDDFGNEQKFVAVEYGRRYPDPDPLLTASDRATQATTLIRYTESTYTNEVLENDVYRSPLPADVRTYQLTGYTPTGSAGRFQSSDFVTPTPTGFELLYDSEIGFGDSPTTGRQRRLIEQVRMLYRSDDLSSGLPLYSLDSLALPYVSYKLAFTPEIIANIYQRPQPPAPPQALLPDRSKVLGTNGGYVLTDNLQMQGLFPASDPTGGWWIQTGEVFYSPGATDPATVELATARAHFFRGRRYRDVFGNDTAVQYDSYDLLPTLVVNPVGNSVTVACDYRVLQPATINDPNGNQSAVAFDALGFVVATAVMDKSVTTGQDSIVGCPTDLTQAQIDAFFADPQGPQAAALLVNATSRIVYDLGRFTAPPSTPQAPNPTFAALIARETHVQNLSGGQASRLQISFSYSDGFGREIQRKKQADAGQWIAGGWTIWNNKGLPVREYEPFFAATHDFSYGTTVGVSSTVLLRSGRACCGNVASRSILGEGRLRSLATGQLGR